LHEWRNFVCGVMILIVPTSFIAQDANRGLLYSNGGTRLNDGSAPAVAAIFPDSLVQTLKGFNARIDVPGSTVLIQSETMVQFQGHELALEHGTLQLDTAREMEVIVGCVTITPVTSDRTQYSVTDVDGKVKVVASKNDVQIHVHGGTLRKSKPESSFDVEVREGQQATRQERCGAAPNPARTAGATGGLLTNPWVIGTAGVVAAVVACLGVCHDDDPISPDKP
jgi:hypothetical protein